VNIPLASVVVDVLSPTIFTVAPERTGLPVALASFTRPLTVALPEVVPPPPVVGAAGLLVDLLQLDIHIPTPTMRRIEKINRTEKRARFFIAFLL
jgi:hypothetical protein